MNGSSIAKNEDDDSFPGTVKMGEQILINILIPKFATPVSTSFWWKEVQNKVIVTNLFMCIEQNCSYNWTISDESPKTTWRYGQSTKVIDVGVRVSYKKGAQSFVVKKQIKLESEFIILLFWIFLFFI